MNKDIIRYRRELRRELRCGFSSKRKLLAEFTCSLADFSQEQPNPTYQQLLGAFGPPKEMAAVLMETLSESELTKYSIAKKFIRILAGIAVALFIAFTVYVFYFQQVTVIEVVNSVNEVTAEPTTGGTPQ